MEGTKTWWFLWVYRTLTNLCYVYQYITMMKKWYNKIKFLLTRDFITWIKNEVSGPEKNIFFKRCLAIWDASPSALSGTIHLRNNWIFIVHPISYQSMVHDGRARYRNGRDTKLSSCLDYLNIFNDIGPDPSQCLGSGPTSE